MIQLDNVTKTYSGLKAVDGISFGVNEGQTMVLLGTSGCGKTTTLRMINRLIEPSGGQIIVNGQNILQQKPEDLRRGIGYVLQHTGLFPHYTIAQNISVVPRLLKWSESDITNRTTELLHKLQLDPETYAAKYPAQLSGGQQQRVGLARALAANAPVLLMDEPFGALDPVTRTGIRNEFKQLDELKKKTILMVTHDVQEAFELGDVICLMDKGKIVQQGTPTELLFKPANDFVKSFFKDQLFLLQLKTVTLRSIFSQLHPVTGEANGAVLDASLNLAQTMELMSAPEETNQSFVVENEGLVRQVDIGSLLTAFSNHIKLQAHG